MSPPPGPRTQNLARILSLVHQRGDLSRAALTEATGLNRSTIADLVAELEMAGLATECDPAALGRVGRPSPRVVASADVVAIAVNPEVDAVDIAAVGLDRSIRIREYIAHEEIPDPQDVANLVEATLTRWRSTELAAGRVIAVGIAVPGLVRSKDGLVRNAPHLNWIDVPLADMVTDATGLPCVVDNDATLGALAEHLFGAARGVDDVVYLNGGASGIGGGLVIQGRTVTGRNGYAGEFGHNHAGSRTPADTLENEVNRQRLLDAAGVSNATDAELPKILLGIGEEADRQARILGGALANAVNVLNPAVILLGGFLAALAEHSYELINDEVRRLAMPENAEDVEIRSAALGADRLLIGAAERAFEQLLSDPVGTISLYRST